VKDVWRSRCMVCCACAVEVWLNSQLAVVVFMTTHREKLSSGDIGTVSKLLRQAAVAPAQ